MTKILKEVNMSIMFVKTFKPISLRLNVVREYWRLHICDKSHNPNEILEYRNEK